MSWKAKEGTCLEWFGLFVNIEVPLQMRVGDKGEPTIRMVAHKRSFSRVGHDMALEERIRSIYQNEKGGPENAVFKP